jgi:hypothetical protein
MEITDEQLNWTVEHYRQALKDRSNAKILWSNRSIYKPDWLQLKKFLAEYKIKNVIEYGVGLSTELMMMEGIEVLSLETLDWWADICRKAIGNEIITYQEGNIPEIDRKFDFAFVDGPQTKRTNEILHAKQHSDIIYLHDLRPEEVKLLDDWEVIENYGKHYYKK